MTALRVGFLAALTCSVILTAAHFPPLDDYRLAADEGTYFRQASTLAARGLAGFSELAASHLAAPDAQMFPPPLRIGHLLPAALFVRVHPSPRALSALSLVCYALLCLVVFEFVRRLWDEPTAFVTATLLAYSPLGCGLARRALMDTDVALFTALTLMTFIAWTVSGSERRFVAFLAALMWLVLVKESNFLLVPFFVAALVALRWSNRAAIHPRHLVLTGVGVPVAVCLVYAALLGGPARAFQLFGTVYGTNVGLPNSYVAAYGAGPWYEYIVDYLLLSPLVMMLFFLFCGRSVSLPRLDRPTMIALGWRTISWLPSGSCRRRPHRSGPPRRAFSS